MAKCDRRAHLGTLAAALGFTIFLGTAHAVPIFDAAPAPGEYADNLGGGCNLMGIPDQRDTDHDGYANACDPDLNNDGTINFLDLAAFRELMFTDDATADFTGDGVVNFLDLSILSSMFFGAPGPAFVAPRDAGIPVVAPASWALLLVGALAWGVLRRTRD